jgi:integrase
MAGRVRIERCIYRRAGYLEVIVKTDHGQLFERVDGGLREAREVRATLEARRSTGDVPVDASMTTGELVDRWIAHRERIGKVRPTTARRYRQLMQTHGARLSRIRAARQTAVRLQAEADALIAAGVDPRQLFAILRAAFRQAVRWKLLPYSPVDAVELPTARRPELAVPTHDEVARLLAGAGDLSDPFRAGITIAAGTGLRRSEVLGLRWSNVDLAAGVVRVRRGLHAVRRPGEDELVELTPKSDRGRRDVELPSAVGSVLERYRKAQTERRVALGEAWAHGWHADDVVIDDGLGRPIHPDVFSRRFTRLRARVGVRADVRLHDLRALYVTEALAAGVDPGIVSRQAGHSTVSFTFDVYQRVRREDARAAADAIDRVLGDVISAPKVDEGLTDATAAVVPIRRRTS